MPEEPEEPKRVTGQRKKFRMAPMPPLNEFRNPRNGHPWVPSEKMRKVAYLVATKGMSRAAALRLVYPNEYPTVLRSQWGSSNMAHSPHYPRYEEWTKNRFRRILAAKGVTEERVADKISDLLDATEEKVVKIRQKGGGEGIAKVEVKDNRTQRETAALAADLLGLTSKAQVAQAATVKLNINNDNRSINVGTSGGALSAPDLLITSLGPVLASYLPTLLASLDRDELNRWMRARQEAGRTGREQPPLPLLALPPGVSLYQDQEPSPSIPPQSCDPYEEEALEGEFEDEEDALDFGDYADEDEEP